MRDKRNNINDGWLPIVSGVLMLSFWTLFALFLPMHEVYIEWVLDSDWTWINLLGFLASLSGVFAILVIYSYHSFSKPMDQIGLIFTVIGIVILTCILFFEAFILKGIALENPDLISLDGSFYRYPWFKMANISGGIFLSIGIMFMGSQWLAQSTFKKWKTIMLITAFPLFGLVILPGNVRLLGVLLYSISFISIGVEMIRYPGKTENG